LYVQIFERKQFGKSPKLLGGSSKFLGGGPKFLDRVMSASGGGANERSVRTVFKLFFTIYSWVEV